jgi:hypothetical protein
MNEAKAGSELRHAVRSFDTCATGFGLLGEIVERQVAAPFHR